MGIAAPHRTNSNSERFSFVYNGGAPAAVHSLAPRQTLDCELPASSAAVAPINCNAQEAEGAT